MDAKATPMALRPPACKFIEKGTQTQIFLYDFAKFLRTPIVEHLEATVEHLFFTLKAISVLKIFKLFS